MTPDERSDLSDRGNYFFFACLTPLIVTSLSNGIFLPVSCEVALSLFRRRTQTWVSRVQLAIVCFGIIGLSGLFVTQAWFAVVYLKCLMMSGGDIEGGMEDYFAVQEPRLNLVQMWISYLLPVLNDAFIMWRAWVIYERQKWALYFSVALWFADFGLVCSLLGRYSNIQALVARESSLSAALSYRWHALATLIVSLVVNIMTTFFIAFRLWTHIRSFSPLDYKHRRRFQTQRVLWVLVDAGAFLVIIQFTAVVESTTLFITNDAGAFANAAFGSLYSAILLAYPALIISLVAGPFSVAANESTNLVSLISTVSESRVSGMKDSICTDVENPSSLS